MSLQRKPSIVFVHGLWADGSCFSKLIPTLQNEGFEVIASQHGLDSHASDVDCVKRTLGRVSNPGTRFLKRLVRFSTLRGRLRAASAQVLLGPDGATARTSGSELTLALPRSAF